MFYALGLILATAGSALACFYPLADAFGLIKVAVGLIGAAILWTACAPGRLRRTALDAPLAACGVAFLLSWAYSIDPISGLLGVYGQPAHGLAGLLPAVLIFYAVAGQGERWPEGPFVCAALVAIGQGLACAGQLAGLRFFEGLSFQGDGRAIGLAGGPTFLGAVLAPCLPACLWLGRRGGAARALGIAGGIGGFLAMTAAGSRGPWIAVGAGLLAALAASGRFRPGKGAAAAALAVLGLLAAFSGVMGKARSDSERIMTWTIAARAGAQHPVLGWGPDTFPMANRALKTPAIVRRVGDSLIQGSAHNDLLQAWATTGALGLIAYVWLWAVILGGLWSMAEFEAGFGLDRTAAILGSAVALFVSAKFNPVPASALYIVAALAGGTLFGPHHRRGILWALGVGAVIATAAPVGRQMLAETLHSFGNIALREKDNKIGIDLLRRANEIAPEDTNYANARIIVIRKLAAPREVRPGKFAVIDKRDGRRLAIIALRAAAGAVKAHPQDPGAHELMATAEMFAAQYFGAGLARSAMRSAKRAVDLDPLMRFSAAQWHEAALVGENRSEAVKAQALVEKIQFLVENRKP